MKIKKFYRILLLVFLLFVLVACGGSPSGDNPGGSPSGDNPGGDGPSGDNPGGDGPSEKGDDQPKEVIYRTVIFDTQGGDMIGEYTITIEDGKLISEPNEPIMYGYVFEGWYLDDVKFNFDARPVTSDIVLVAHWKRDKLKVTYYVDGSVLYEFKIAPGESLESISVKNPVKEGYTFVGWSKELPSEMLYDSIYIEAVWEPISYTLTVDYNDGVTENLVTKVKYGDNIPYINPPARVGYSLDIDALYSIPSTMPANDLTITLNWIANKYTVMFYFDDGITGPIILQKAYASSLSINDPTREGYVFKGWSPAVPSTIPLDGGTYFATWEKAKYTLTLKNYYGNSDKVLNLEYEESISVDEPQRTGYSCDNWFGLLPSNMPASNLTFEVSWMKNTYSLTIDYNDEVTHFSKIDLKYNDAITGIVDPTRKGYTFTGWSPELPSNMPASDLYLTATWEVVKYTITLDYNDGVSESSSIKKEYLQTLSDLSNPSREGYTFNGWYYNDVKWDIDKGKIEQDITLVAHWTINKYKLTINYGHNQGSTSKYYDYNSKLSIKDPTLIGHTFTSWDVTVPEKMPASDLTITALWTVNEYTITLIYNDGITENHTQTFDFEEAITDLYIPDAREGYYFSNWVETVPTYMPNYDFTLNAVWKTDITYSINTQTNEVTVTGCKGLDNVVIWSEYEGYPVTSIGYAAFMNKVNITSITIPDSIINIGAKAFYGCTSIEEITLPTNLASIEEDLFNGCTSLKKINIQNEIVRVMTGAFVDCTNLTYNTYDNALYLGTSTNPYLILIKSINNTITSCTINDNCKVIYDNAFYLCENLDMITIPNSVQRVGVTSFRCYYGRLIVKLNFTSLETLFNINLENCGSKDSSFYPDKIYLNNEQVTDLAMPNTKTDLNIIFKYNQAISIFRFSNQMTEVKSYTFWNCSFTTAYIPLSIKKFNYRSFSDCRLTVFYYEGTKAQWNAIETPTGWSSFSMSTGKPVVYYTVHCSDGDITTTYVY